MKYITLNVWDISMLVNSKVTEAHINTEPVLMKGRLLPLGFFVLSDQRPIIGSVTASHNTATIEMTPAIAGCMPAMVVRKKLKKEKNTLYPIPSPMAPIPYPMAVPFLSFSILV